MKAIGVNIGTCGTRTVRLRPMLVFEETHSTFIINAHPVPLIAVANRFPPVPQLISSLDKVIASL